MSTEIKESLVLENIQEGSHPLDQLSRKIEASSRLDASIEPVHKFYLAIRRCCEFPISLLLIVLLSPILIFASATIKLTSRGPAFYTQTRVGKDGRRFKFYKLRTMVHNAEALTGPVWATKSDPRVTTVGRFLRNTHIDEIPQLLNVLLGQMSFIGPRPERPEFVSWLEPQVQHYFCRLNVLPGMTGLSQLFLPPDSSVESVRRKLIYDIYYVRNANLWLDFRISLFTVSYLTGVMWRSSLKYISLPNSKVLQEELLEDFEPVANHQSEARPHL